MRRDLAALSDLEFDLVVVGGGIFGICAAWDAALRGLSVALVEKGDFSHATSAHSFKMVHGGIRYLQHGDLPRIRESSRERRALLRNAPHLVEPLPIVIPTYRGLLTGRLALRTGLALYDLLTLDRNRGIAGPERRIPGGRFLSREESLTRFPGLRPEGLTGAALFCDAQMYNPPRLALAYLQGAVKRGAVAANYVEAVGFLRRGGRVTGVRARDLESGEELEIRGRLVLNAAGPWAQDLLQRELDLRLSPRLTFSRDACFVVNRTLLDPRHALAVLGETSDPDALLSRGHRHLFVVPWRGYTLVGVWHVVWTRSPDAVEVGEDELERFVGEVNGAYPGLGLDLADVTLWNAGLVLFGENRAGQENLSYGKRSRLVDHGRDHGLEGLISLVGVRWTTSRGMAEKAVHLAFRRLGRRPPASRTEGTPVHGGDMGSFSEFLRQEAGERPEGVDPESFEALLRNYGTAYRDVLGEALADPSLLGRLGTSTVLGCEVMHAARSEMALHLEDVVLRRTDLGTGEYPGEEALQVSARLAGQVLGWDEGRRRAEIERTVSRYPSFARGPRPTAGAR